MILICCLFAVWVNDDSICCCYLADTVFYWREAFCKRCFYRFAVDVVSPGAGFYHGLAFKLQTMKFVQNSEWPKDRVMHGRRDGGFIY